jgi:gliding motility-associated-like protein
MKKKSIYLFLLLFVHIPYIYAQQIVTDNTQQPNELIQSLIGTNCASASNVSSAINGDSNNIISYGSFSSATSNFPLQSGLILSTGSVSSAGNTLNTENLNEGNIDWTTDADIESILGISQTLNATSIEFDFESVNNFVSFKYLFASDEYQQEYPCNFKDVFAIFIKRAGTADPYINIALIPNSTTEISTNTIHPNIAGFCDAQNVDYFRGYNLGDTNFNGITEVLTTRADILPNETYHIKLVIADHIDQRFDSAVFIEAEGFGNSIDLGQDQTICGSDLSLDANINNPSAIYNWFLNGVPILGENNPILEVNSSGSYEVEVAIPSASNTCTLSDTIEIEIIPFQDATPIEDWLACNSFESDGTFDFDFTQKNEEIYSNLPSTDYLISYHTSIDDAQNNSNPITGIYQNVEASETVFVRIESLSGDCLQIGSFDFIVSNSPDALEYTIDVCNGELVEQTFYNLNLLGRFVSNFQLDTLVTFHLTENDAINFANALSEFPLLEDQLPFIFARIENLSSICPAIIPVNLDYIAQTDIGINRYNVNLCLDPTATENIDGIIYDYDNLPVSYNIDAIFSQMETEYPGIRVNIDVILGLGPAPRILTTSNTNFTLPISIRYLDENCPTFINIELHKNLLYNRVVDVLDISRCDDESNDGIVEFNLAEIVDEFIGDYDIDVQLFETLEDVLTGNNTIDINIPFTVTNSQTIFLSSSYNDCALVSEMNLTITEGLYVPPTTVDYCGNTDPNTSSTSIVLEPLIDSVMEGLNIVGQVKFYLTEDDAENQNNNLTENYAIVGNQQTLYVRVSDFFSGCYDVSTIQVNITNAINASNPEPLIICDDNLDGMANVNLENIITQLSGSSNNLTFTFFESYNNAFENQSAIVSPSNYNTTTVNLFIRAEILDQDCFTIFPYDVFIYANPQLNTVTDFINCAIDINAPSGFLFINKDLEVINGQVGMQVLYYVTEDDALNRMNPIDKNVAYQATSNPQTIFVRLEKEFGNNCFKVAPMQIEVRQAPIYNNPTDIFECDINKSGLATTDLNEKITEISAGSTSDLEVTFHLTPLNAEVGTNEIPLIFRATSNPQLIYARIENITSRCYETQTFLINTLSLPEVNLGQSLTKCGNNYDFSQAWDLTQIELEVLEGRQYNIEFSYFESDADVITDNNPIANPEAYINSSNPQTLFAKIRNVTTGCFDSVPFDLVINSPPQINPFENYNICENSESEVNLSEINQILLDSTFNTLVSYYTNEVDAEAKENPLNLDYFYTNTTETLFARVEYNTTNCYAVYPFILVVNTAPIANQPNFLEACDDDFDGFIEFDLTQQNSTILGIQNPSEFSISYYNSEINANNKIEPVNTDYIAYTSETIFVRLENIITTCYDITQFSTIIIDLPIVFIEDQVVCLNDLPLVVSAETNNSSDSYLWSTNATSPETEIFEIGTYSVTITNQFGCINTITFSVTESEVATINVIETIDFSDPNNITVTISGIGNYIYQLNDRNSQTSNVFQNVPIGYNIITVIDQNGCAQVTRQVLVIDVPKHMTPNNDGIYDTWHIAGAETLPGTVINIFDRYGKLLKQLRHNDLGWNGTYKGRKMPTDDYWFVAKVIQNGLSFDVKGHFTLRR